MDDPAKLAGGGLSEYAYSRSTSGVTGERTAADVLKDIVSNLQEIIRSEVRLARAEIKEETSKLTGAAIYLGIGAVLAIMAVPFLLWSLVYALTSVMSVAASALVMALILGVAGAVLVSIGRGRLKNVSPKPEKTIDTVKENIEWMKNQTR